MFAMDSQPTVDSLRGFLGQVAEDRGLAAAYLFGSVARGTAGPRSDVDVAVLYAESPPPGLGRFRLEGDLEEILHRPVQVITLNDAPADLAHRVLRDGILLVERDPARRVAFEVQSRAEYFDLEPLRRLYRRLPRTAA
jgi:predicted nucleotidyltransferase